MKFIKALNTLFWYKVFRFTLRRFKPTCFYLCANRHEGTYKLGPIEIKVIQKDTREPDGYAREELYYMLKLIREQEIKQGWKVPEPDMRPVK